LKETSYDKLSDNPGQEIKGIEYEPNTVDNLKLKMIQYMHILLTENLNKIYVEKI